MASVDCPPKKHGKPSDFQGRRHEYLNAAIPEYISASKSNRTGEFWNDTFAGYWAAFPWRLPLAQDPEDDEDLTGYSRPPENEDEVATKKKVLAEIERVSRRFGTQIKTDRNS